VEGQGLPFVFENESIFVANQLSYLAVQACYRWHERSNWEHLTHVAIGGANLQSMRAN
jgi:hypothetical protein